MKPTNEIFDIFFNFQQSSAAPENTMNPYADDSDEYDEDGLIKTSPTQNPYENTDEFNDR